jgi:hypothetical protein
MYIKDPIMMKIRPSDHVLTSREEICAFLKANKDTWFTTEELALHFNDGSNELSRRLTSMIKEGMLIIKKWDFADTNVGRRRIRLWKADLD